MPRRNHPPTRRAKPKVCPYCGDGPLHPKALRQHIANRHPRRRVEEWGS